MWAILFGQEREIEGDQISRLGLEAIVVGIEIFLWLLMPVRGADAQTLEQVYAFESPPRACSSGLIVGSDGFFYGTSLEGGSYNRGTLYRCDSQGNISILASFNSDTGAPATRVIEGPDGCFYGTTEGGGTAFGGTIYKVSRSGDLQRLVSFTGENGLAPTAELLFAADGNFYGTTSAGSTGRFGCVFRLTPDGQMTQVFAFSNSTGFGRQIPLIEAPGGTLYGSAASGGGNGAGTIFAISPKGEFTKVADFSAETLVLGADKALYGTSLGFGGFFQIDQAGRASLLKDLESPFSSLQDAPDGALYGVSGDLGGRVWKISKAGEVIWTTQFSPFGEAQQIGAATLGPLVEVDGYWYGVNAWGGPGKLGTVFRLNALGEPSFVGTFPSNNGAFPQSGVIEGGDGYYYGTTYLGGKYDQGTIFRVTAGGNLTTLVAFDGTNGARPLGGLIRGRDGDFYGTTSQGGGGDYGTVFRMSRSGELKTLVFFDGSNGSGPRAALVEGPDGLLYGATAGSASPGHGTVFRVDYNGTLETIVNLNETVAIGPLGGVTLGNNGEIWGTSREGGRPDGGTVFKIDGSGMFSIVHSFGSDFSTRPEAGLARGDDGFFYGSTQDNLGALFKINEDSFTSFSLAGKLSGLPMGNLVFGTDGNLYGTTMGSYANEEHAAGSETNFGSVFKMTTSGEVDYLVLFNYSNGSRPVSGVLQAADGSFYGTTSEGGARGGGTIFRVRSAPEKLEISSASAGLVISWRDKSFRLESSPGLGGNWTTISTAGATRVEIAATARAAFFRLVK